MADPDNETEESDGLPEIQEELFDSLFEEECDDDEE